MADDINITIADVRAVGYCVKGMRHFAKLHKLDFRKFTSGGIPASELLATNDQLAVNIVTKAKERRNGRRG